MRGAEGDSVNLLQGPEDLQDPPRGDLQGRAARGPGWGYRGGRRRLQEEAQRLQIEVTIHIYIVPTT